MTDYANSNEKNRQWLLPERTKHKLISGLHIVATPIGNLRDISLRALDTLELADAVLCEDTRVSGKLLQAYGLKKKLIAYNDHADERLREKILSMIEDGQSLALISDAGSPLIADPGYKLVQACYERGLYVSAAPGACAAITAIQLSAMPSDAFSFIGFLPNKAKARADHLARWADVSATLIAYETAPRLIKALEAIHAIMPQRRVAIVREITKLYEERRADTPQSLIAHYEDNGLPKGEIVLVIEPPSQRIYSRDDIIKALRIALKDNPTKKAASAVADQAGWKKKDVYQIALELKE